MKRKKLKKAVKAAMKVLTKNEEVYGEIVTTKASEDLLYIEIKVKTDKQLTFM